MSPCWSLVSGHNWHCIRGRRVTSSGPKLCPKPPEIQPSACQGVKSTGTLDCCRSQTSLNSDAEMTLVPSACRGQREAGGFLMTAGAATSVHCFSLFIKGVSMCGRASLKDSGPTRLSVLHWTRFASSLFSLKGCLLLCIGEQLSLWERQERGWLWVNMKRGFAFEDCYTEDLKTQTLFPVTGPVVVGRPSGSSMGETKTKHCFLKQELRSTALCHKGTVLFMFIILVTHSHPAQRGILGPFWFWSSPSLP